MRCIGTLEFVSDFHNKCHQTQRQLLLDKERLLTVAKDEIEIDFESDKENTSPRSNVEIELNLNGMPAKLKRKSSRMEGKLGKLKKIKYKNGVFDEKPIPGLDHVENSKQSGTTDYSDVEYSSVIKSRPIQSKGHIIGGRKTAAAQKRNPLATGIQEESGNRDGQKKIPLIRLGRRTKGKRGSSSTITNVKTIKTEKRVPRSTPEKKTLIGCNAIKLGAIEKVENSIDSSASGEEEQNTCQSLSGQLLGVANAEINRSQRIPPEMVKIEKLDSNDAILKTDGLAQVPNDAISMPDGLVRDASSGSTAKSPRPGDEAEESRDRECDMIEGQTADATAKIVCIEDDCIGRKGLPKALMIRKSVIESVKNGKTFGIDAERDLMNKNDTRAQLTLSNDNVTCQRNDSKLMDVPESFDRSTSLRQESTVVMSKELNKTNGKSVGNFRERRKNSEGQFGKLSELITDEQKEIIETLYTVNMGVVDEEEVYRNIKILDKIKAKCEICGKTYPRMDKCQVHVWGHLNMKPYCCKSCDFVTLTVSNIRCHIRKRHLKIKPFQCNLCDKTYGTAVLLEEHINSHTGAKPYKCKLCDFATSNRQVLSYHKTTHKPVKDISCEVCGKKFFSNCRMRAHMIVHNKDRSLMCKLCSTYLCNAEALEKHYQKVHSRDYICNICGVRTRSRKALTNHENVHSEAKYRCPLCSNVYKSKHMLKEHLLKHQGIRKYKCELCQKSFAQQSHIAAHMSVHMGKRYPCPGCNKLFNRRDNMRIHTRRCKIFKSDPDAKNIWISRNSNLPIGSDGKSIPLSEEQAAPSTATESTESSKTDKKELETGLGSIRINLLPSGKTDYSNSHGSLSTAIRDSRDPRDVVRDQGFHKFKSNDGEIIRIGEVEIFPLSNSNVVAMQNESNTVITENVLRPEYF